MDKLINYIMFRKKTYGNIQDYASAFITVFKDGKFYNRQSFPQIRKRLQ